jgi:hypothetical protein
MKQKTTLFVCVVLISVIAVWGGSKSTGPGLLNVNAVYPEPYAQDGVNPFVGKWVNFDPETLLFTKMAIGIENGSMMVELWASCLPEDCYWGRVAAQIPKCETERIELTWILPIVNEFQEIIYMPDGDYLILKTKSFYTYDRSGRCETQTLYFMRGDFVVPQY